MSFSSTTNTAAPGEQQFRAFLAVPLPEALRQNLQRVVAELREDPARNRELKKLRWTRAENYHLTVAFLGDIPESLVPNLRTNLNTQLADQVRFSILMTEIKPFPPRRPHVLATMFSDSPSLVELYQGIVRALEQTGIEVEHRKFLPHLTLARNRNRSNRLNMQNPIVLNLELAVEELILYRSTLSNQGARHDIVFQIPLRNEVPATPEGA